MQPTFQIDTEYNALSIGKEVNFYHLYQQEGIDEVAFGNLVSELESRDDIELSINKEMDTKVWEVRPKGDESMDELAGKLLAIASKHFFVVQFVFTDWDTLTSTNVGKLEIGYGTYKVLASAEDVFETYRAPMEDYAEKD